MITKNIKLNDIKNIVIHPTVISNKVGNTVLFLRPSTNTGASSLFRYWRIGNKQESVPTTNLRNFFLDNKITKVRLLKVDCEGSEFLIFSEETKDLIAKNIIEFIALEYHPQICGKDKCQKIHNILCEGGYSLTKVNGQCIYHLPGLETNIKDLGRLNFCCNWDD
ncbi:FkbM family methyltransferase [Geminocystis sp. CENA526]|uniref:FkbM family methyltransferase n=1 Tax=Geminocystis sp. CENA526 TaxID=1355871 RepID=UPI003D6F8DC6